VRAPQSKRPLDNYIFMVVPDSRAELQNLEPVRVAVLAPEREELSMSLPMRNGVG
jgi:hypothetical protein